MFTVRFIYYYAKDLFSEQINNNNCVIDED